MRHATHADGCRVCALASLEEPALVVATSELFTLVSLPGIVPIPGWVMLCANRHVAGPAHLDDREAALYGRALRHAARIVETTTCALRVYVAALGEADPHFHTHLVPRYAQSPEGRVGFALFELQRLAREGLVEVDEAAHLRLLDRYRLEFERSPLPDA